MGQSSNYNNGPLLEQILEVTVTFKVESKSEVEPKPEHYRSGSLISRILLRICSLMCIFCNTCIYLN